MAAIATNLDFQLERFFAIFDPQVIPMLPIEFQVNWPFGLVEANNRFSRWPPRQPPWISDRNNFSYFDLQGIPMLPTKCQVNWPFGSGEEAKIFLRWPTWQGGSNEYPQSMFLAEIRKIKFTPVNPSFTI